MTATLQTDSNGGGCSSSSDSDSPTNTAKEELEEETTTTSSSNNNSNNNNTMTPRNLMEWQAHQRELKIRERRNKTTSQSLLHNYRGSANQLEQTDELRLSEWKKQARIQQRDAQESLRTYRASADVVIVRNNNNNNNNKQQRKTFPLAAAQPPPPQPPIQQRNHPSSLQDSPPPPPYGGVSVKELKSRFAKNATTVSPTNLSSDSKKNHNSRTLVASPTSNNDDDALGDYPRPVWKEVDATTTTASPRVGYNSHLHATTKTPENEPGQDNNDDGNDDDDDDHASDEMPRPNEKESSSSSSLQRGLDIVSRGQPIVAKGPLDSSSFAACTATTTTTPASSSLLPTTGEAIEKPTNVLLVMPRLDDDDNDDETTTNNATPTEKLKPKDDSTDPPPEEETDSSVEDTRPATDHVTNHDDDEPQQQPQQQPHDEQQPQPPEQQQSQQQEPHKAIGVVECHTADSDAVGLVNRGVCTAATDDGVEVSILLPGAAAATAAASPLSSDAAALSRDTEPASTRDQEDCSDPTRKGGSPSNSPETLRLVCEDRFGSPSKQRQRRRHPREQVDCSVPTMQRGASPRSSPKTLRFHCQDRVGSPFKQPQQQQQQRVRTTTSSSLVWDPSLVLPSHCVVETLLGTGRHLLEEWDDDQPGRTVDLESNDVPSIFEGLVSWASPL